MWWSVSEPARRRTFWLVLAAVVGQEACGVLALLQYAERVFLLADPRASPARLALLLGAAQLLASVLALYLVEKLGRKVRPIGFIRNVYTRSPEMATSGLMMVRRS